MSVDQNDGGQAYPEETVELTEGEHVVSRGSARTHWLVRVQNGWVPAAALPSAQVESLEPLPGVVWTRRIRLNLARGTELLCVQSAPQQLNRSPLGFLEAGPSPKRQVHRTGYRVGRGGGLEPDAAK